MKSMEKACSKMDARKVLNDAQKNVVDACDAEAWIGPHYPLH